MDGSTMSINIEANSEGGLDVTDVSVPITMFNGDGELIKVIMHDGAMKIGVRDTSAQPETGGTDLNFFNWYEVDGGILSVICIAEQEAQED